MRKILMQLWLDFWKLELWRYASVQNVNVLYNEYILYVDVDFYCKYIYGMHLLHIAIQNSTRLLALPKPWLLNPEIVWNVRLAIIHGCIVYTLILRLSSHVVFLVWPQNPVWTNGVQTQPLMKWTPNACST